MIADRHVRFLARQNPARGGDNSPPALGQIFQLNQKFAIGEEAIEGTLLREHEITVHVVDRSSLQGRVGTAHHPDLRGKIAARW